MASKKSKSTDDGSIMPELVALLKAMIQRQYATIASPSRRPRPLRRCQSTAPTSRSSSRTIEDDRLIAASLGYPVESLGHTWRHVATLEELRAALRRGRYCERALTSGDAPAILGRHPQPPVETEAGSR